MKKTLTQRESGYTLVEMLIIIVIMTVLISIFIPRFSLVIQRAYQAKAKENLHAVRAAVNLYYSDHEGIWPLSEFGVGFTPYAAGTSLTKALVPTYIPTMPVPKLNDQMGSYNELAGIFDEDMKTIMGEINPRDVFIIDSDACYTPFLSAPYAYNNGTGFIFIANGNLDLDGVNFYRW
ncbi:MAG: type II secretion system GspH family protein [Elusimicrobia bacterium]|nr:type II secretion system GspH family protein [Candidatus Obscuribacterium magneticum]